MEPKINNILYFLLQILRNLSQRDSFRVFKQDFQQIVLEVLDFEFFLK